MLEAEYGGGLRELVAWRVSSFFSGDLLLLLGPLAATLVFGLVWRLVPDGERLFIRQIVRDRQQVRRRLLVSALVAHAFFSLSLFFSSLKIFAASQRRPLLNCLRKAPSCP